MFEFNNRIQLQRRIIQIVNRSCRGNEQLGGLNPHAIERWRSSHGIDSSSEVVGLLREAGNRLQCLATKSQDPVSRKYLTISTELHEVAARLERAVTEIAS